MQTHVPSTSCDVISFNGQTQLCPLQVTCAEWRDLSNHTRMSRFQSRTPQKKAKNLVTLTWKFPWKSCQPKKMRQEKWIKREERKWKVKVKTVVSLLSPKTISKFSFLCMPELRKLIFCIWIRRPQSVLPVNNFVLSFSSL